MPQSKRERPPLSELHFELGALLAAARTAAGVSTRGLGYSSGHISNVEHGHVTPSTDLVQAYIHLGSHPSTTVDQAALDSHAPAPWNHVRARVADGTFISVIAGPVYKYAGGAPLYVSNWAAVGGPHPSTVVDQAALDNAGGGMPWNHGREYPADGTFVTTSTGQIYRALGERAQHVSNWKSVGGRKHSVEIDQAAIDHAGAGGVWNHLRSSKPKIGRAHV